MSKVKGFSIIEGVILLGVILLMAGVGYVGWKALVKSDTPVQNTSAAKKSAEVITTKADLEAAEKALDDLDFNDPDATEAQTQASL